MAAGLLFEGGFRAVHALASEHLRRDDRPGAYYAFSRSDRPEDFPYSKEKPPRTFRIAALGDSFTFPTHLQFDDAYPKRLERMLNLRSDREQTLSAEVINFGRMGASAKSEMERFGEVLRYHPDLVLLEITLNDPEPRNFHQEKKKHPGKFDFGEIAITPESHPILYHWKSLGYLVQRIHNTETFPHLIEYYRNMYRPDGRWKLFVDSITKMSQIAAKHQVKLAAFVFPLFYTAMDDRYPFRDIHQQITSFLDSIAVPNLDLLVAFNGMDPERLVVLPGKDSHPNEIAHRIAADALYRWMEETKLIPPELLIRSAYSRRGVHPIETDDFIAAEDRPEVDADRPLAEAEDNG